MPIPTLALATLATVQVHVEPRVPDRAIAWVQTNELSAVLDQGLEHPLVARILAEPLVAKKLEEDGFDPAAALSAAEAVLGESPLELAAAITRGGIGLGLVPGDAREPRPFVITRGEDADEFEAALETIEGALATFRVIRRPEAERTAALGPMVESAWVAKDEKLFGARTRDGALVLATTWDDLALCVSTKDRCKRARADLARLDGADSGVVAWVDIDALEAHGDVGELRTMVEDPGVHIALGPMLTYLGSSSTAALRLGWSTDSIELDVVGTSPELGEGASTFPSSERPGRSIELAGMDGVAHFALHRDLSEIISNRTELFPPRKQPELAEGLSNFALFVGGTDAVDEVLAAISERIEIVVESVPFDARATPEVPLPAAAFVLQVEDPAVNGARLVGAFQSLVALQNVQEAMNGRDGRRLTVEMYGGTTMTKAQLPPPAEGDAVDLTHNVVPACALIGDRFVLGTHDALVRRLLDRIAEDRPRKGRTAGDRVHIDGPSVRTLLADNRDLLVTRAVLTENKPRAQAEAEIELLLSLLEPVRSLEFRAASGGEDTDEIRAGFAVRLK